jgi:hypothetical protein
VKWLVPLVLLGCVPAPTRPGRDASVTAGSGGTTPPAGSGGAGGGTSVVGAGGGSPSPADAALAALDAPVGGFGGGGGEVADAAVDRPPAAAGRGPAVLMRGYNLERTGNNLQETVLTPAAITAGGFGKLYCKSVDDEIYGQILYQPDADFGPQGRHDAVFVVTMNDSVYAFDATDGTAAALWEAHFADASKGVVPVPARDLGKTNCGIYKDISRRVGILSTPAVDPATSTMYVVARTKEQGDYLARLHALDMATGKERSGSPVEISATTSGSGAGSVGGTIRFDPMRQNQRAGLLLHQGVVYVAFSSHCDEGPYHGWVLGYDAASLRQVVVYNDTPNGANGGIWMSGMAPAVDAEGNIYLVTGNGSADLAGGPNRGEAFLKLRRQGATLQVLDWFTPFNYATLEMEDRDLGSSGAVLIPGTNIVLAGNKEGKLYLVDRNNFGKFRPTDNNQLVQSLAVTGAGRAHIHGTPVHWKSSDGEFVYLMAEEDFLRQYRFVQGKLTLHRMSDLKAPQVLVPKPPGGYTMPGGAVALTADGERPGTGLVWVNMTIAADANQAVVPGVLRVFDAADVTRELWNSEQNRARDSFGNFAKFNPPTVTGGRVYLPTFSNQYCVYGRLAP